MPSNVLSTPSDSARNLGVIFDSSLTMSNYISSVSESCFLPIRNLCRIRSTLDFTTAKTTATSLIHTKVDYCNSLFLNFPRSQLDRLQLILNSAARTVSRTPHFTHISPILKLHIGSKSSNVFTTKFSQSPTKYSNLATPRICTIFSVSNLTRALGLLSLSLSNSRQFALDVK